MTQETSIITLLKLHEGVKLKPYRCPTGYLTIGIGRNLDANGISHEEAELMLENDIQAATTALKRNVSFFTNLSEARQTALIDMCFNLGLNGLLSFKKMLSALSVGNYSKAAQEVLNSRYATQVGGRAVTIATMIEKDCYPWEH